MLRCALIASVALTFQAGCFKLFAGGTPVPEGPLSRTIDPEDVVVPEGFAVEPVAWDFTFPVAVTFDGAGHPVVLEAGYSYGEVFTPPKLIRLLPDGKRQTIVEGERGPWTGVTFHQGAFYVADGGVSNLGRILRITEEGQITELVKGLPTLGDHHTNGPAVSDDGWIYFSTGTATNSGIVGMDNYDFGWLARHPEFHDVPCQDIVVTGHTAKTPNPLTPDASDEAVTGAFVPFGVPGAPDAVIPGRVPCSGAVMRVRMDGGPIELVAWGFRNPFGLAFAPDGALFVTENGHDVRGSRPIFGAADNLWRVEPGRWYGFPDFSSGRLVEDAWHEPPGKPRPTRVIKSDLGEVPEPAARFGVHSSSNGFDFSRSASFGYEGQAFVAQFGDMSPGVGEVLNPVGFKVVRAEPKTGVIHTFAANRKGNGPASVLGTGGLERPVAARFNPTGDSLYVVDFGVMPVTEVDPAPQKRTGMLWRIHRVQEAR